MSDTQVRVILWSIPRTVSTAFVKCMSNLDDVQIIQEPFECAFKVGPESKRHFREHFVAKSDKIKLECDSGCWDADKATYQFVKENILEANYPGKKVVFVKDFSYAITWKINMLPKGYRHAFLIRNPAKTFASWKKLLVAYNDALSLGTNLMENNGASIPEKYGFGESFELYEHLVRTGIEPNPVIIDSDDLLENPESILRQFCDGIGIEYTDKLMSWNAGDGIVQEWKIPKVFLQGHELIGYYEKAFSSQKFVKPNPAPDRADLPNDVNTCIDAAMPYYEKMYALRLTAEKTDLGL
ncbi:branched-chain-amino-acid aminotransferase-like protein 2 [Anneissia japonica]|uniref:branched-chain-amino-acid aminotransferase-like protein 2 n=1 Tax=Anneissia japonica TaxID=1529436 RepID=UPI001425B670|nr:branched-chain-amino-acid aminotransferase-like protein 2 [Anneissia japonica]XP_033108818.1 branched-chain-amino-acid aminotransferase-like protein 2 [Anneissia japonica]